MGIGVTGVILTQWRSTKAVCTCLLAATFSLLDASSVWAQRKKPADKAVQADQPPAVQMLEYASPRVIEMSIGLRVTTRDGALVQTVATTVFPTTWPEQQVEIVETNMPSGVQHAFRDLPGNNRQLVMTAPGIPAFQTTEGTLKVRVTKSHIIGPRDPSSLVIPNNKQLSREVKHFTGNSPFIDASNAEVRKIARDLIEQEPENAWQHVKLIYDWVRENIKYTKGEMKDTRKTLRDKAGDCEEMTSMFVALCRASNVPARCVWIPGHCYPEFYLEDADGHGFWFPCQAAGTESFGTMQDHLPILQKGDRFKLPEKQESQRYLADHLTSKKMVGQQKPKVEFIRLLLGDAANLKVDEAPSAPPAP
ncbi:MAG: transglutaminase domain-containing protein [Pirellulaceae bacterium]|nr:transglutaminase domain-containing protein [Pirellulaceae bacterium]